MAFRAWKVFGFFKKRVPGHCLHLVLYGSNFNSWQVHLNECHFDCALSDVHYWCQVWISLLQYFQRYSQFCDSLQSFAMFVTSSIFLAKTWISLEFQNRKHHSSSFWKVFKIRKRYFLHHRHFKQPRWAQQGYDFPFTLHTPAGYSLGIVQEYLGSLRTGQTLTDFKITTKKLLSF